MLRVIISPAKKMIAGAEAFAVRGVPPFPARTLRLLDALLALDAPALQDLWRVSDRLLGPCLDALAALRETGVPARADDLAAPALAARVSPAVFAYVGLQYQSMAPSVMDERSLAWLEGNLRILSGFYGCVRPFDAVLPYRLEMGAKLAVDEARDLYGFWGADIARAVCAADGPGGGASAAGPVELVNLASVEYARAVLPHLPARTQLTTCIFGEEVRGGRPVQRSTASKTARGSAVRWMAERGARRADELAAFDVGYRFCPELSDPADAAAKPGGRTLVFLRA